MSADRQRLLALFRGLVEKSGARPAGFQFPVEAKVVAQRKSGGAYVVDAQVLDADGAADPNWPLLADAPLATALGGPADAIGAAATIEAGTRIAVSFFEGDPSRPFVSGVFSEAPPDSAGIYWQIVTRNTRIGVEDGRRIFVETDQEIAATVAGGGTLTLAADSATIALGSALVRVESGKIVIEAGAIELGEGATEPLLLGDQVQILVNSNNFALLAHTHPDALGSTASPVLVLTDVAAAHKSTIASAK